MALGLYDTLQSIKKQLKNICCRLKLIEENGGGSEPAYKVYTALLTQTGINPPVPTVLENTIGTIWFERIGAGIYHIKSNSLFTTNKVWRSISGDGFQNGGLVFGTAYIDDSTILLVSYNHYNNFNGEDEVLGQTPIEIRVYN